MAMTIEALLDGLSALQRVTLVAELRKKIVEMDGAQALAKIGISRRMADIIAQLKGDQAPQKELEGSSADPLPQTAEAWVTEDRWAMLQEMIKTFQRKAAKLGVEPVQAEVIGERARRVLLRSDRERIESKTIDLKKPIPGGWKAGGIVKQLHIRITGDLPQLSGWRFVAALDHKGAGNLVRSVPGGGAVPSRFLTAKSVCEHCGTSRNRNKTLVVVNESGEYKQVGSNCLKDFLGHGDAEALAALAEWRSNFWSAVIEEGEDLSEYGDEGGAGKQYVELERYLEFVACAVREDGFVSKAQAEDTMRLRTADLALMSYWPGRGQTAELEPTDKDKKTAADALAWARGLTDEQVAGDTFLHNMRVIAGEDAVSVKEIGITAALISAYQRATAERKVREKAADSQWVGQLKERRDFKGLVVTRTTSVEGHYGVTIIHRFLDPDGNVLVWYASGAQLEVGKTYDVKATIKKHDEYKGVKQTVITRASAVEVGGDGASILDSLSAIDRIKLSAQLASQTAALGKAANALERVRVAKQVAELVRQLSGDAEQAAKPERVKLTTQRLHSIIQAGVGVKSSKYSPSQRIDRITYDVNTTLKGIYGVFSGKHIQEIADTLRAAGVEFDGSDIARGFVKVPVWQARIAEAAAEVAPAEAPVFPTKEAASSYSGISHSGGGRSQLDQEEYERNIAKEVEAAQPFAETPAQQQVLAAEEAALRADYIQQYRRMMAVRAGTYSGYVAGRAKLNAKQANSRNSAYDKSIERFNAWLKENTGRLKAAVLAARSPEQLQAAQAAADAEQAAKDAKQAESQQKNVALMVSLLSFKSGDRLPMGSAQIVKVSKDKDGNPSSLTYVNADGSKPWDDKINVLRVLYRGDKAKMLRDVEAARAAMGLANAGDTQAADDQRAEPESQPLQIIEHVTGRGKTIRGIVRTDLTYAEAKAIDEYTFKKDGGYFIREKHLEGYTPTDPAPVVKQELTPEQQAQAEADRIANEQAREQAKRDAQVQKLREAAQATIAKAEEELSRDRNTNTARRANMASNINARNEAARAIGLTMQNLADAIAAGEAKHLAGITSRAAVETLQSALSSAMAQADTAANLSYSERERLRLNGRKAAPEDVKFAKYPEVKWGTAGTSLSKVLEAIKGKKGSVALANKIRYSAGPDAEMVKALTAMIGDKEAKYLIGWWNLEQLARIGRLQRAGINNTEDLQAALLEYLQYREGAREEDPIKKAERAIIGQKVGIDFFPTPSGQAQRMVQLASIQPGERVLEPSAGNGNIADAAAAAGAKVDVIEISSQLRAILEAKGYDVVAHDFLTYEPAKKYDAVLMNPPFSDRLDAQHIMRAFGMLKPGGRLVAIAGEGVFFGKDKKAVEFRDWLEDHASEVEQLPQGTFTDSKLLARTSANARMIVMQKA